MNIWHLIKQSTTIIFSLKVVRQGFWIFFIMGVTIFLYLSQLQKLTVACYSFFMKNFYYRCNNIFVLVTITKKKLPVAVIHLFYFLNFRRRGAFFCVCFLYLAGNRSIFCCIFALLFCRMSFFCRAKK